MDILYRYQKNNFRDGDYIKSPVQNGGITMIKGFKASYIPSNRDICRHPELKTVHAAPIAFMESVQIPGAYTDYASEWSWDRHVELKLAIIDFMNKQNNCFHVDMLGAEAFGGCAITGHYGDDPVHSVLIDTFDVELM